MLMGLRIDPLTERDAVAVIIRALETGRGGWAITPNLEHLRRFRLSPELRLLYYRADLVLADGMPLVWASRLQGTPVPERVAGSALLWSLSGEAAREARSIFLLGGEPGAPERAAAELQARFAGLRVAGTMSPPFGFERDRGMLRDIETALAQARPDIVYVGVGFPKQEQLIELLRRRFPQMWFLGVGIAIAYAAGDVARAPRWMRVAGLEWLHRLVQEPRRLAGRYVLRGTPFAFRLLLSSLRVRAGRSFRSTRWT